MGDSPYSTYKFTMPFLDYVRPKYHITLGLASDTDYVAWLDPQTGTPKYREVSCIAWCPECNKEYPLVRFSRSFYCVHRLTDAEIGNINPISITDIGAFIEVKHIECLIFEIQTEKW